MSPPVVLLTASPPIRRGHITTAHFMEPEMQDAAQEIELAAGDKKIKVRGTDIMPALCLMSTLLLCYAFYVHSAETKESNQIIASAMKEIAAAQREGNQTQRETSCIVAYKGTAQAAGEVMDFCKRIAR